MGTSVTAYSVDFCLYIFSPVTYLRRRLVFRGEALTQQTVFNFGGVASPPPPAALHPSVAGRGWRVQQGVDLTHPPLPLSHPILSLHPIATTWSFERRQGGIQYALQTTGNVFLDGLALSLTNHVVDVIKLTQ